MERMTDRAVKGLLRIVEIVGSLFIAVIFLLALAVGGAIDLTRALTSPLRGDRSIRARRVSV